MANGKMPCLKFLILRRFCLLLKIRKKQRSEGPGGCLTATAAQVSLSRVKHTGVCGSRDRPSSSFKHEHE